MPSDRLLVTLLRSLQTYSDQQDTSRLLATAASLFTSLSNPLNISLLTAQLLSAPAIWTRRDGLRTCLSFMGVFQSSAATLLRYEEEAHENKLQLKPSLPVSQYTNTLRREEWVKAVIKGADDRSPRWMHLMVFAGLLVGFEGHERQGLSKTLKRTVEDALVKALNLALQDVKDGEELCGQCITLVLTYSFELLTDVDKSRIDYDRLLPVLVGSTFFSQEGYQSTYFLANVDMDVIQTTVNKFTWSGQSSSFRQLSDITSRPLLPAMGPLSRLMSYVVEHVKNPWLIQAMMDDVTRFAKTLATVWRQNKISEVDVCEEPVFFNEGALTKTLPVLWQVLRSALFATVILLKGVLGRVLGDAKLAVDGIAPVLAAQTLHILRHIYFISSRLGPNAFSQYTFVYLTAIDIICAYPSRVETFVREICPQHLGRIPAHPLDRNLDLYFLNTVEHFTLVLSPRTNEDLLVAAATPYLASGGNNHLLEIFEAAHSVMLAVLSAPQSAHIATTHIPLYVEALFKAFPRNLSSRQFRLAFKTLIRISTPPSTLAATQPTLPETLVELLHHRVLIISTTSRPLLHSSSQLDTQSVNYNNLPTSINVQNDVDEPTTLILTLIDSLPFLPLDLLEDWLPQTAGLISRIGSAEGRQKCRDRFWQILSGGEMDVERSCLCVAWWGTRGGREAVMFELRDHKYEMSGALSPNKRVTEESKL